MKQTKTSEVLATPQHEELLVAIMNDPRDMAIAREKGWYRIPVSSARKWVKDRWPPQWLAFYQTKVFNTEKYSVRYYAKVIGIQQAYRRQLFPNEPEGKKTDKLYYKVLLAPLQTLPEPIVSLRWRRIVFIPQPGRSSSMPWKSMICTTIVPWKIACGRFLSATALPQNARSMRA